MGLYIVKCNSSTVDSAGDLDCLYQPVSPHPTCSEIELLRLRAVPFSREEPQQDDALYPTPHWDAVCVQWLTDIYDLESLLGA